MNMRVPKYESNLLCKSVRNNRGCVFILQLLLFISDLQSELVLGRPLPSPYHRVFCTPGRLTLFGFNRCCDAGF